MVSHENYNFLFPYPSDASYKFGEEWPSSVEKRMLTDDAKQTTNLWIGYLGDWNDLITKKKIIMSYE